MNNSARILFCIRDLFARLARFGSGWWAFGMLSGGDEMCDYSLEVYGAQPAREGEKYVTTRFPSGTIGLASPANPGTPVCVNCDTQLLLKDIPALIRERYGIGAAAEATFTRLETGGYRDAIQFENGKVVSLQQLPPGIGVSVTRLLENARTEEREAAFV
jgi:hypothetical protein